MGFLTEDEVLQIERQLGEGSDKDGPPPKTVLRWARALLADRRDRVALIMRLSRQLHHVRERLRDAGVYFDKLIAGAHVETRASWPGQILCESCGAPVWHRRQDGGAGFVNTHPDGKECNVAGKEVGTPPPAPSPK